MTRFSSLNASRGIHHHMHKNGWFLANLNVIQNYTNSWRAWIGNDMAALGSYQRSTWNIQCETSLINSTFASTFIVQYRMKVLLLCIYENLHSFGKYLIWKKFLASEVRVHAKSRCRGTRKVIIKFKETKNQRKKKRVKCHGICDMNLPYNLVARGWQHSHIKYPMNLLPTSTICAANKLKLLGEYFFVVVVVVVSGWKS